MSPARPAAQVTYPEAHQKNHHRITNKLIDGPVEPEDDLVHLGEVLVEDLGDSLGPMLAEVAVNPFKSEVL